VKQFFVILYSSMRRSRLLVALLLFEIYLGENNIILLLNFEDFFQIIISSWR